MASALELIEKVHKAFAAEYGLTFFMTDSDGKIITSIVGDNRLCSAMLEKEDGFLRDIETIHRDNRRINKTLIYEILSGMYMMVSPVSADEDISYYLWAGVLAERDADTEKLSNVYEYVPGSELPVLEKTNREDWLKLVGKLAELSSLCLCHEAMNPLADIYIDKLRKYTRENKDATIELFSQVTNTSGDLDFMGLAEQTGEDIYTITKIIGENTGELQGVKFPAGEGFLGRAALTEQRLYWEDIGEDRRSKIFSALPQPPTFMFTDSLKMHDDSIAVLFGGSFTRKKASSFVKNTAQMSSALVESSLLVGGLRHENSQQLTRLASLIDICGLMASTPDPKRMVLILLDISINLVEGHFSSIIIKDRRNGKGKLITRGTYEGNINEYVKEVMDRTNQLTRLPGNEVNEPQIQMLPNGESVIECPLAYGSELMGVLSVGITEIKKHEMQELLAFLQTLSIIGGVSLQLADHKSSGIEEEKTGALQLAIAEFDRNAYDRSKESAELASLMATRLELPPETVQSVVRACQLSYYTPSFILKMFPESDTATVMETGDVILNREDVSRTGIIKVAGYIYALCNMYVLEHRTEEIKQLETVDSEVLDSFMSLVRATHVSESEFDLPTASGSDETQEIASAVKSMKTLSPREQEVLILVSEGRNNQEIAEALYISAHTVKNHITKIFNKLDVSDRVNAISKVYRKLHNY